MTARFDRAFAKASRANLAVSVGFLLATSASPSAARASPEQRRARTPDVGRPCTGEIPNVTATTAGRKSFPAP